MVSYLFFVRSIRYFSIVLEPCRLRRSCKVATTPTRRGLRLDDALALPSSDLAPPVSVKPTRKHPKFKVSPSPPGLKSAERDGSCSSRAIKYE